MRKILFLVVALVMLIALPEGEIVAYNGATWQRTGQHIKSNVYKPKSGSSK